MDPLVLDIGSALASRLADALVAIDGFRLAETLGDFPVEAANAVAYGSGACAARNVTPEAPTSTVQAANASSGLAASASVALRSDRPWVGTLVRQARGLARGGDSGLAVCAPVSLVAGTVVAASGVGALRLRSRLGGH